MKNENDSGYSSDEEKIANNFNEHFHKKISDLKKNADQEMVEDPLARLRKRMSTKSCKFNLKKLSKEKVQEGFTKMKKKKSSGSDGLTQEQLAEGVNELEWTDLVNVFLCQSQEKFNSILFMFFGSDS